MTQIQPSLQEFLAELPPFDRLSTSARSQLENCLQPLRYRIGQVILVRDKLPYQIAILYEGQARLLGYHPQTQQPVTLRRSQPGEIFGWVGLMRGVACETVIASTEVVCLTLPAPEFLQLLEQEPAFAQAFQSQPALVEVFDLLAAELQQQAQSSYDLKDLALQAWEQARVRYLKPGRQSIGAWEEDCLWLVSGGGAIAQYPIGSRVPAADSQTQVEVMESRPARLLGLPRSLLQLGGEQSATSLLPAMPGNESIPYAPDQPPDADLPSYQSASRSQRFPHVAGQGKLSSTLACLQMLSQYFKMPFRRDVIQRVLIDQQARNGDLSLFLCGAVAELMGLRAQLVTVPATALKQLPTPALISWDDSFAVLYEIGDRDLILGIPESGILRGTPNDLLDRWGETNQVLLLQTTYDTPQERFGLRWFLPAVRRHWRVLLEVLLASFFVQLFGLANPLLIQLIIDRAIFQKSIPTLQVLGILLIAFAVVEAILSSVRTYLFVDTTNRIDMALGSKVIHHLLHLPLRFFERRPVGETSSRINELENIRQFLTGTALTVVLDVIFSIIYVAVMLIYSWQLTLVALSTIPLFVALTFFVAPTIRRLLRERAERNAETQAYLVEVLSGVQTVKAQNIELRSRWQWQERYARYISAGFKTVVTSTAAAATSDFLNKLSGLLVIWVGAYLVLEGKLTIGQWLAFRIIAGYVTSPVLRLTQLWQNFQETGLSLERLSDIVDSPQEQEEDDRHNIPMPMIQGNVQFENVSFRFASSGPLQLTNVSLQFPVGTFVGIVGQSGSGKSTLMKLLPRLYPIEAGRILIDSYDINKVELYSLRRQMGVVPQDSLLFQGSVQENIALTNPDATAEEIIAAAQVACAHDFIMDLPSGYNTRVGERGSALSGGQRQRIAIARTILQNPRLLVLDEATSALDYDTERQVCLNLIEAFRGRTVFFITHRLSTIRHADTIVVMDKGSVVEQGTHEELMRLRGRYFCLYQQQDAAGE